MCKVNNQSNDTTFFIIAKVSCDWYTINLMVMVSESLLHIKTRTKKNKEVWRGRCPDRERRQMGSCPIVFCIRFLINQKPKFDSNVYLILGWNYISLIGIKSQQTGIRIQTNYKNNLINYILYQKIKLLRNVLKSHLVGHLSWATANTCFNFKTKTRKNMCLDSYFLRSCIF